MPLLAMRRKSRDRLRLATACRLLASFGLAYLGAGLVTLACACLVQRRGETLPQTLTRAAEGTVWLMAMSWLLMGLPLIPTAGLVHYLAPRIRGRLDRALLVGGMLTYLPFLAVFTGISLLTPMLSLREVFERDALAIHLYAAALGAFWLTAHSRSSLSRQHRVCHQRQPASPPGSRAGSSG